MRNLFILIASLCSFYCHADIFNAGEFQLTSGDEGNEYQLIARLPSAVVQSTQLTLPDGCEVESLSRQASVATTLLSYRIGCQSALNGTQHIGTPWFLDGAKVRINLTGQPAFDVSLNRSFKPVSLPLSDLPYQLSKSEVVKQYLWQGMLHIWFGWDHLFFVLCLCLLAKGKRLLALITGFTLGHSLTLALSFYQVIQIPIAPIEVLIAVSIVLMAREAILVLRQKHEFAMTASMGIVLLFGLIHGLGFASALAELGVPQNEIGLALVVFNLGVEAGQLAFVAGLYGIYRLLEGTPVLVKVSTAALYVMGCTGMFWAVERLAGFI